MKRNEWRSRYLGMQRVRVRLPLSDEALRCARLGVLIVLGGCAEGRLERGPWSLQGGRGAGEDQTLFPRRRVRLPAATAGSAVHVSERMSRETGGRLVVRLRTVEPRIFTSSGPPRDSAKPRY